MDTKGIDVEQVREAISPKTKAISWVNYAGVAPDIEGLQSVAKEFNLILIEDNAHGLGGSYKGKPLGSFGDFATQSFHATKNIQCGEGGALVINDAKYVDRAEIIREKGTDRSKYFRGEVDKYQWVDKGSSYLLAESLAAILLGQIENFREIQRLRKDIWIQYSNLVLGKEVIHFPSEFRDQLSVAAHIFYIEIEDQLVRSNFVEKAKEIGISVTTHYQPLHNSRAGDRFGISKFEYENTIKTSTNLLRFPIYIGLSENSFEKISTLIREC
jgi:dTDP-4-amino-4,6-dideoxygalactose transaminase